MVASVEAHPEGDVSSVLRSFHEKVPVAVSTSRYRLRTARTEEDLLSLFRLRHAVFFGGEKAGYDSDGFDCSFDHLMIIDNRTDELCGTYRLGSDLHMREFYSEQEFSLRNFLARPGIKIELGRAAILEEHRNGRVLDLLWRGIAAYVEATQARYLFGCTSVMTTCPEIAMALQCHFREIGAIDDRLSIETRADYSLAGSNALGSEFASDVETNVEPNVEPNIEQDAEQGLAAPTSLVPGLLSAYLNAGARMASEPAVDRGFGSIDFLTILDLRELHPAYRRRYFGLHDPGQSAQQLGALS